MTEQLKQTLRDSKAARWTALIIVSFTMMWGYFLTDGQVYNSRDFSDLLQKELGVRGVLHITAPIWFLRCVCTVGGWWGKLTGKVTALNMDKFNIMRQRNWRCDIRPAQEDLGFSPKVQLPQGVKESVAWYKKEGWI